MSTIAGVSFTVQFNLTGAPTLVLTDTTSTPPSGLVGVFNITQPDGYTRNGDINSPDIAAAGGSFSYTLRLGSDGLPQRGEYIVVYNTIATGYDETFFTRQFQFTYRPVTIDVFQEFDVFTPNLSFVDKTVYSVSNYNNSSVTRSWVANSVPTGNIVGSGVTLDLKHLNNYYDAYYTATLTSSVNYTHQVYSWLTIQEVVSANINTYAATPPPPSDLVDQIHDLKVKWDDAVNKCREEDYAQSQFEIAQTLFKHIVDRVLVDNLDNIYEDIKDLVRILNNNQIPSYTPTNQPIQSYNVGIFAPGAAWGNISGNIAVQTDLWTILEDLRIKTNYIHDQQSASSVWVVQHDMGKYPSVTIVDSGDDEVIGDVNHESENKLRITFSSPISGKAYLN